MSLAKVERIRGIKERRADQRLADLQRSRRQLEDARETLRTAEAEVAQFKKDRKDVVHAAYAAVCGEEMREVDLRNLNQRLDRLIEQENGLIAGLADFRSAVASAEEAVRQASVRFHAANRNFEKWELMVVPMRKSQRRAAEKSAEREIEDRPPTVG